MAGGDPDEHGAECDCLGCFLLRQVDAKLADLEWAWRQDEDRAARMRAVLVPPKPK